MKQKTMLLAGVIGFVLFVSALGFMACNNEPDDSGDPGTKKPEPEKRIYYSDYGAAGDGEIDDAQAIRAAHEAANAANAKVYADENARYYIGNLTSTIPIETDTDWGNALFIIDDNAPGVADRVGVWIFTVRSKMATVNNLDGVTSLEKGQNKITSSAITGPSLVRVVDSNVKRFIREGANANAGSDQTDMFLVDKNGNVDPDTPIIWDFDTITSAFVYPVDTSTLTITGGIFSTINNQLSNQLTGDTPYFARGIMISRSNTVVEGIRHEVTGEGAFGRAYNGFIRVQYCAYVTVQNCELQGRRHYRNAANTADMGTYDFTAANTVNLTVRNCWQSNDMYNGTWWGIFASNFSKNIVFDNVQWSRFDAHQGVHNVTIIDSAIGHQGLQSIGSGTLLVENTTVRSGSFISLREDYGSTWEGEVIIRGCTFEATGSNATVIGGRNSGTHNFGYQCYLPQTVTIDGLNVIRSVGSAQNNLRIFADSWGAATSAYATIMPELVQVRNITRSSGSGYVLSATMTRFNAAGTQVVTDFF